MLLSVVVAMALLSSCANRMDNQQVGSVPRGVYATAEEIRAMPPCKAVVVLKEPCSVCVKMANGRWFHIGSPGSQPDVGGFLDMLRVGQTYEFPDAFVKYQK